MVDLRPDRPDTIEHSQMTWPDLTWGPPFHDLDFWATFLSWEDWAHLPLEWCQMASLPSAEVLWSGNIIRAERQDEAPPVSTVPTTHLHLNFPLLHLASVGQPSPTDVNSPVRSRHVFYPQTSRAPGVLGTSPGYKQEIIYIIIIIIFVL